MPENPRIEELRRRVQKDPASIAFAQLAEEYRRAGHYEDAIDICRAGLQTHPSYLSARVTLGRALIEMNDLENAETELRYVLQHAAENLAAIRAMAEIHQRRGELSEALGFYKSALELARHDPDLEQTVDEISRTIAKAPAPAPVAPPKAVPALTPEQRSAEFLAKTFDLLDLDDLDLELPNAETVAAQPAMAAAISQPLVAEPVVPEPEVAGAVVPEPVVAEPVVPEPMLAQPVMAAAKREPEPEFEPEQPVQPVPLDDLALLDAYLSQTVPVDDPRAKLNEVPSPLDENADRAAVLEASGEDWGDVLPLLDENSGRPEPSRGTRLEEAAPGAAWGIGAPQASGEERGEGPPPFDENSGRPEPSRGTRLEEAAPGAAWGIGAPQASGEERGEGPPPFDENSGRPEPSRGTRLEEAAPGAAWGIGAPQASGEERGEGPPRLEEEDDFAPMDMGVIVHPALPGLERFLGAIHTYRQRRAV